jgi:hypothetical protein
MENMIGKKVKIVSNLGGNRFEIGEIVEIIEPNGVDGIFLARNEAGKSWYISHRDYVHIAEEKQFQISRRDYFAAAALQALMTIPDISSDNLAKTAVYWADELIKQLDKE